MCRAVAVRALDGYQLRVTFNNGLEGTINLSGRLWGPMFEPLRNIELFEQVRIDEFGAVCWPNGADLARDGSLFVALGKPPDDSLMRTCQ